MNGFLVLKLLHILAVAVTIGGILARQMVRASARQSDDLSVVAALTNAAARLDRAMIIPASTLMLVLGLFLAIAQGWPIFGYLQGASQNWLLASNGLLVIMVTLISTVFIPHNKKVAAQLQAALRAGRLTPELSAALDDRPNQWAHLAEEIILVTVAALMVLKPI